MNDESARPSDLQEKVLVGRLLTLSAGKASEALDTFSGWLLAGFGAAFALIFGDLEAVLKFVDPSYLRRAVGLFLVAVLLGVFEKGLASIVAAGTATLAESANIGRELAAEEIEVDFSKVFKEAERATLYPARWLVRRGLAKAAAGDFAVAGRMYAVMSQVQGIFVLAEVLLCIAAGFFVASGLGA